MATEKSSTLKAKTTRRAAKPAKRKRNAATCPVAAQARIIEKLDTAIDAAKEQLKTAESDSTKQYYQERIDILYDRMRACRTAASFLTPKSAEGAMLLLGSIDTDAESMRDTDAAWQRQEWHRRLQRSLYGIVRYLEARGCISEGVAGGVYLHRNPHHHLQAAGVVS